MRRTALLERQLRAHGGTLLVWLAVLVVHGFALLALAPPRGSHAPPGKRMQMFWIPIENVAPKQRSAGSATEEDTAAPAAPGVAPSRAAAAPRRVVERSDPASSSVQSTASRGDPPGRRGPAPADILDQRPGIRALLPQLPALAQPAPLDTGVIRFDGGRGRARLPGTDATRIPGLVVRDQVSLDQRVQGALALVGWGRTDPCPDIRRHVRSAIEAQDPDEVSYWTDRERRCR